MDIRNIIVEYFASVADVPSVGTMQMRVRISAQPIFDNAQSMQLRYFSDMPETRNCQLGESSTLSYRAARADGYRQRMQLDIILPHDCLHSRDAPYRESRNAARKHLAEIIAEHERLMDARRSDHL